MPLMRGKLPARQNAVSFLMGDFLRKEALPPVPKSFGHVRAGINWGMLGNDMAGDCVIAAGEHETMLWLMASRRTPAKFTTAISIANYRIAQKDQGLEQFNPRLPDTDTGLDMVRVASWRRKVGLSDANGVRHMIRGYARIDSYDDLCLSTYLFGASGVGLALPSDAEEQFNAGKVWEPSGPPTDGHCVSCVGRNSAGNLMVVTWGKLHAMTRAFYDEYCDEAICYFSLSYLTAKGFSPEAFNQEQLDADLSALSKP